MHSPIEHYGALTQYIDVCIQWNGAGDVADVVEKLPSMNEALIWITSTSCNQARWHMPEIPAPGSGNQRITSSFQGFLTNIVEFGPSFKHTRPCLKTKTC